MSKWDLIIRSKEKTNNQVNERIVGWIHNKSTILIIWQSATISLLSPVKNNFEKNFNISLWFISIMRSEQRIEFLCESTFCVGFVFQSMELIFRKHETPLKPRTKFLFLLQSTHKNVKSLHTLRKINVNWWLIYFTLLES